MHSGHRPGAGILFPLLLLLLLPGCVQPGGCPDKPLLAQGDQAPDLTLTGLDGQPRAMSTVIAGKVALVDLWATWCGPCKLVAPHLQALHNRYRDRGFTVVGIMSDATATQMGPAYMKRNPVTYPTFLDDHGNTFTCTWGQVGGIPLMVLLDRQGKVIEVFRGADEMERLTEKVAAALAAGDAA